MYLDNVKVRWDYVNKTDGLTVAEHYEWGRRDDFDKLPILPILTIDSESLRIIETRQDKFPDSVLEEAMRKFTLRNMRDRDMDTDDYNVLLTDGQRSIVVSVHLYNKTINCYGRLLIKAENRLFRQLEAEERPIVQRNIKEELGEELNPEPKGFTHLEYEHIVGTTQTERAMKKLVLHNLTYLEDTDKPGLIRYFYTGLFPDKKVPHNKSDAKMFDEIVEFVRHGWTDKHEQFGSDIIGFVNSYQDNWNSLVNRKRNLDSVC
ncbi:hypothetical protein QCM8_28 [Bacillus phage QCM8]|nr:hypothetical protein QCM8_28 [Bacillus phage QCM8]